uniref:Putative capsid protein n=1 Tax=viral metagenome TaxID=1070528 RepID=A0A6M3IMI0_9ZZZZ
MQFSGTVTTITREAIVPKVSDTVLLGNVALLRVLGNAKSWGSGYRLDIPVKYQKSTTGGIVGVGGTLDTTRKETRIKLQFEPQRIHKPVVVDDIELAVNEGDQRVLELLATEMDSISQDLLDDIGTYFYTGTSATGSSFDSILNAADDSTNYTTYGAQLRSTYTTIKGYYAASIGALAIADLRTAHNAVKIGADGPSFYVTTPAIWTAYEALLTPTVRAGYQMNGYPQVQRTGFAPSQQALKGDIGFDGLWFRGALIASDEKCTAQKMFAINDKHFSFYGMELKGSNYQKFNTSGSKVDGPQALPIPKGFNWSGLMRSINQPAQVGHFYYVGNFVSNNPRYLGQMTGITD